MYAPATGGQSTTATAPSATVAAVAAQPARVLHLRRQETIDSAFLLQLVLALTVLLGGLTVWLRWMRGMKPAVGKTPNARMRQLDRVVVSPRTRMTLVDAGGHMVLLTEFNQGVDVKLLPPLDNVPVSDVLVDPLQP